MMRKASLGAVLAAMLVAPGIVMAQQVGTAAEARTMLDKAVAAVKADKAKAIEMFNAGEGGFKDRDLYPFCFQVSDGVVVAGPEIVRGKDTRALKDPTGTAFGQAIFDAAKDGAVTEVSYMFPRPGADKTPVAKVSFVTKAGDLGCGVGYYK